MRIVSVFFLLSIFTKMGLAQDSLVHGAVMGKGSGLRISMAEIKNLRTGQKVLSNDLGVFKIPAIVGDTLRVYKDNFLEAKAVVQYRIDVIVQLQQSIVLNQVTVKGQTKKQEMEDVLNDYRKKGTFYNGKPPLLSYLFSPVTALYELVGKTPGQARKFNNYYHNEMEQSEVDRRFNKTLIRQFTTMPEPELVEFMNAYRPTYEQASRWNDYDMMSYIKRSLTSFENRTK
ncbi:hypothetical protein FW774_16280 [Pedobacter sp. BS3]|uniref:hypothetical protein n=1 Tax=Pedobacter sp. BS3 TaxID=2567937 RepID=UPI0011ECE604|nr:hypothetical protein [Pedobacter sp. BS3]TZF82242.1 hypothetical protein FW774_16280 [Pedobacter sp. BS3]